MAAIAPQWSSRFVFLMAAIGSAVGLGNLWRFPFYTGQNGGAAFVLAYLLFVILIGYPVLVGELAVGRHKGLSAVGSIRQLALDSGASRWWALAGWIGVTAAFMILTTYSLVAGQIMAYSAGSFAGMFAGNAGEPLPIYAGASHALVWHGVFMAASAGVVSVGLHGGIERLVKVLMPLFFCMLFGLCVYALSTGAAAQTFSYLFSVNFSALTPSVLLAALSQACFSIGIGGALMITYGSFLSPEENIGSSAGIVAGTDTFVALIAGLMIFPVVFAFGLNPAAGGQLIFDALPVVFLEMPGGVMVGGLFFFLAFIAALTTSIAILITLCLVGEELLGLSRASSTWIAAVLAWVVGGLTLFVAGLADWLDFVSGSVFLPLGVVVLAVFVGWIVPRTTMRGELPNTSNPVFSFWRFAVRYLVPVAVGLILIVGIDAKFDFGLNTVLEGLAAD